MTVAMNNIRYKTQMYHEFVSNIKKLDDIPEQACYRQSHQSADDRLSEPFRQSIVGTLPMNVGRNCILSIILQSVPIALLGPFYSIEHISYFLLAL